MLRYRALVLLLGLVLGACEQTPRPAQPTPRQLAGRAQEWTGSTGVVKAVATNRQENYLVTFGSIGPTGDFVVTLPASVEAPDSFAPPACQESETGKLEVSPRTLTVSLVEALTVAPTAKDGEPEVGELIFAQAGSYDGTRVVQAYAPVAGTVKGSCRFVYGNAGDGPVILTDTLTFDLTLVAGWNDVVRTTTLSDRDFLWAYETRTPTAGLSWRYWEYPPPPKGPIPPPSDQR